jgi:hypothetical protein
VIYKLYCSSPRNEPDAVLRVNDDGSQTSFLFDPANSDYQQYLKWLEEGNTPEPADEPV